jgi:hypothetical protein
MGLEDGDVLGGLLLLLVAVQPLRFAYLSRSVWMLKCGVVAVLCGVFALTNVASLASTVPFLLKMPLFAIFGELQKGHSIKWKLDLPSLVALYWGIFAWALDQVSDDVKQRIDAGMTLVMWGAIAAHAFTIMPFHRRDWTIYVFVGVAVTAVCAARFVPPADALSRVLNAFAAHCAVQMLAAAQADEDGKSFHANVRFFLGFIPLVQWVE